MVWNTTEALFSLNSSMLEITEYSLNFLYTRKKEKQQKKIVNKTFGGAFITHGNIKLNNLFFKQ